MFLFDAVKPKQWDDLANQHKCKTTSSWVDWKAERILVRGIEVFIDDGPDLVQGLRERVGDKCKVIQFGGRLI